MEFSSPLTEAEAYRLGQRHGAIAGIVASVAAYYLFKAYKPALRSKMKSQKTEES